MFVRPGRGLEAEAYPMNSDMVELGRAAPQRKWKRGSTKSSDLKSNQSEKNKSNMSAPVQKRID